MNDFYTLRIEIFCLILIHFNSFTNTLHSFIIIINMNVVNRSGLNRYEKNFIYLFIYKIFGTAKNIFIKYKIKGL